ncbi:MAG: hypothetical protein EA419_02960 [Wenzhouxiangella sp.]|nr:MAG: hypothetical protein EA419_02960 [Wenzhouxiangella sp.]
MTRLLPAILMIVFSAGLAAPARALPLVDIGLGAGVMAMGDDPAAALSLGVHVPLGPFWGAEATYSRSVIDGTIDRTSGSADYSGSMLGGFLTLTSPSPGIRFRAKIGLQRAAFRLDHEAENGRFNSLEPALGLGILARHWQLEVTRSRIDDRDLDEGITKLTVKYVW